MNLTQLQYFCTVAKYQNVTKAANSLYISQPALTKTIKSLESELGAPLFIKKGRGIELTEAGKIFYHRVNNALDLIGKGLDEFRVCAFGKSRLKICISSTPKYSGNIVSGFIKENPDIIVECSNGMNRENYFDYDILIYSDKNVPKGFENIEILDEEMVLLIPKSYKELNKKSFELDELINYPFISDADSSELFRYFMQIFTGKNMIPNIKYKADSLITYVSMIQSELGISYVPKVTFYDIIKEELEPYVSVAKLKGQTYHKKLFIAYNPLKKNENIAAFCEYAKKYSLNFN